MTPPRPELWRRAGILFERVLDHPPEERPDILSQACGGDGELRAAVESLLAFDACDEGETEAPPPVPAEEGRRFGAYRLLHPIAQGGMGWVWLAERATGDVEQRVAIKRIEITGSPWQVPLFRRERQILARLEHPNIARFLDGGTSEDGAPYVVMEYVEGVPVTAYCDARRLGLRARLELFRKICGAVQYAHQNLVVHRDLKPANILVTDDGEPKLLDFGIAKSIDLARPASTTPSMTLGRFLTPDYASPEQLAGQPVAMASDLYSLGVLLFELATGCLPRSVRGRSLAEVVQAGRGEPPLLSEAVMRPGPADGSVPDAETRARGRGTTPKRLRRLLSGDLDAIVRRCLRPEARDRYGSAEQLAEDLRRHLCGLPVEAQPPSWGYRTAKFVRRHAVAVTAGAVLGLAAIGFVVVTAVYSQRVARERDRARQAQQEAEEVQHFLLNAFRFGDPYQGVDVGARGGPDTTVRELLDQSTARVAKDLANRPLVQARLLQSLGGVYLNLGLHDKALPLLRQSLAIRQRILGGEAPDVEVSLSLLGHALLTAGHLQEAEAPVRQGLELARKLHDRSPQYLAEALTSYGMLEDDLEHLPEAQAALEEALAIYRRSFTPEQGGRPLAILSIQLGSVLYERGTYDAAEPHLREAIERMNHLGFQEHPEVASALHYLAKIQQARKRYPESEAIFRRALAMRVKLQGAEHPQAIVARAALGKLLLVKGDRPAAGSVFREVLALDRKVSGEHSAEVAKDLQWIAQTESSQP